MQVTKVNNTDQQYNIFGTAQEMLQLSDYCDGYLEGSLNNYDFVVMDNKIMYSQAGPIQLLPGEQDNPNHCTCIDLSQTTERMIRFIEQHCC